MRLFVLYLLCASFIAAHGHKILMVVPINGKSHMNYMQIFVRELIDRGHEVTCITSISLSGNKPNNYTEILIDPPWDMETISKKENMFYMQFLPTSFLVTTMPLFMYLSTNHALGTKNIQDFVNKKDQHFDLVIHEEVYHDSFLIFGHIFNAPVVSLCPLGVMDQFDEDMGLMAPSSHVSHTMLTYTDKMNFAERWYNSMLNSYDRFIRRYVHYPIQNRVLSNNFGHLGPLPSISELRKNISLTFANAHRSITHPRPTMPGLIYIGGAHIKPAKALPSDLQTFIDGAKNGVIYFSMGTVLHASKMPKDKLNTFLETFRKLKQRVIWKFEDASIPNLPENVLIQKWLPQNDILAHPNIVLFISHGGMFSNFEALNYGIQMLMIPFFGDQHRNALRLESAGYGKFLDFRDVSNETLLTTIDEMLTDTKYSIKAKEISTIFHSNLVHPMDEFIWWIEYVIKFRGAKHLRSAAADMSIFTYLSLDVMLVNFILCVCFGYIWYICIRRIFRKKNVTVEKKNE